MNVLSLEESLNLISGTSPSIKKPKRKTTRRTKKELTSPTNVSPVRIPNEKPKKPRAKPKAKAKPKTPQPESPEPIPEDDKKTPVNEHETTVTSPPPNRNKVILSPKRETAQSPVRDEVVKTVDVEDINTININESLSKLRYSILRLLKNKTSGNIEYVMCYDPNGQILFLELNDPNVEYESAQIVSIEESDETINELDSYSSNFKDKISANTNGLVFFDGVSYNIMKRLDNGDVTTQHYKLLFEQQKLNIPQIYSLLNYTELELDSLQVLKNTNRSYKVIQDEQWANSKEIMNDIKKSVDLLNTSMSEFETEYRNYINGIMTDWRTLSKHSNSYYKKFAKNNLTEEESKNFDLITLNMLSRFETFSRSIEVIDSLSDIINDICKSSIHTNEITEMLREKNKNNGKILQENEIEIMS